MLDLIFENIEWILGGIFISFAAYFFSIITTVIKRKRERHKSNALIKIDKPIDANIKVNNGESPDVKYDKEHIEGYYSNIFRISSKKIAEEFLIPKLTDYKKIATLTDKSFIEEFNFFVRPLNGYVGTLSKFLGTSVESSPILTILGNVGSGKSTTLQYFLKKELISKYREENALNTSSLERPIILDFNTGFFENIEINSDYVISSLTNEDSYYSNFYTPLDELINESMDESNEVKNFWLWLISNSNKITSQYIYKSIYRNKFIIQNAKDKNLNKLLVFRKDFYERISFEDLFLYKLLQLSYIAETQNVKIGTLIFDNVDKLIPFLQQKTLRLAIKAVEILKCKCIVTLQPNIFVSNIHSTLFFESIEQPHPDIFEVIDMRLKRFSNIDSESNAISFYLKKLMDFILASRDRKEILIATSGNNIRIGLRNFYNLLLSPLLITNSDFSSLNKLGSSGFFQAFFCSETANQTMYEKNFPNLFNISLQQEKSYYSTIKLRILHILNIKKTLKLSMLTHELGNFGYSIDEIISAINDLITARNPLLLSSNVALYNSVNINNSHNISITRLGIGYYEIVLKNIYYFRESIFSQEKKRDYSINDWILKVREVLIEFEKLDYQEVYKYISNSSEDAYNYYYGNYNSISIILWSKLFPSISNFIKDSSIHLNFDPNHDNYISFNIRKIIEQSVELEDIIKE